MFILPNLHPDLDILLEKLTAEIEVEFEKYSLHATPERLGISSKVCLFYIFGGHLYFDALILSSVL